MAATAESRLARAPRRDASAECEDPVPRPRLVWTTFAAMGALLAGYLVFLILRSSWQFSPWLDGWLVVLFEVAGSALCIASIFI